MRLRERGNGTERIMDDMLTSWVMRNPRNSWLWVGVAKPHPPSSPPPPNSRANEVTTVVRKEKDEMKSNQRWDQK